ncbi:MAG: DUF1015 domain-containing protein [Terriglobales bacterium]|jgi:uncharacterized protein (DUF1015 family)
MKFWNRTILIAQSEVWMCGKGLVECQVQPMAHIAPFRALRYDPARVDLSNVVTQPYDKITPEMQERYYAASPHNLVRIILGKREAKDDTGANTYTRAAAYFRDWRRQGVFLPEAQPSIYGYAQHFTVPGGSEELERRGFIALGQLEDYSDGVVFRHEQTLAKPKADRLDLLRATRAHFGQLFMLYSDAAGEIDGLLAAAAAAPEIETRDEYGVRHQVSKISDPSLVDLVRSKMRDKKLIIADGHHRYETALNYRNERRSTADTAPPWGARGFSSEIPPYEMVMMTFVNMDSPGLLILPTHRVVHGLAAFRAEGLRQKASEFFSVEEADPSVDAVRASGILREAGRSGTALMAVTGDRVFLLDTLKSPGSNLSGLSIRQRSLDVVQLHKYLLEGVLGISEAAIRDQQNISYVRDAGEAMARVRSGGANVAFLMNPVRMRQVRDIAFAGEVLPQKSTDFYPKLLSGLTIYALE